MNNKAWVLLLWASILFILDIFIPESFYSNFVIDNIFRVVGYIVVFSGLVALTIVDRENKEQKEDFCDHELIIKDEYYCYENAGASIDTFKVRELMCLTCGAKITDCDYQNNGNWKYKAYKPNYLKS